MNSIWIGWHAVDQYAERVWQCDHTTLTKEQRDIIRQRLYGAYRRSVIVTEQECRALGLYSKDKPGQERRLCTVRAGSKFVKIVLIIGPDDTHKSGAMKLITVIAVRDDATYPDNQP